LLVRYPQKNIPRYYQAYKLIRHSDPAVDNVQNGRTDSNGQTWPTTLERFPFLVSNRFTINLAAEVSVQGLKNPLEIQGSLHKVGQGSEGDGRE
jgi:hypothetical protein